MEDILISLLSTFNFPVYRQGSVSEYPPSFFTFWNSDTPVHAYYDNEEYGASWDFGVYFYSEDPSLVYSTISDARTLLKQNGFVIPSRGFDVTSDEPTHTGRGFNAQYLEV